MKIDFFKNIEETENHMVSPFKFCLSKENKIFAEDYYNFNNNINNFINNKYKWIKKNDCLIVNDFFVSLKTTRKTICKLFIRGRNFEIATPSVYENENFLNYLKETKTVVTNQTIDELCIRERIIKNLENINKKHKDKLLKSLNLTSKINDIIFICNEEKVDLEIKENELYDLDKIYKILEHSINILLILKDIDLKCKLKEIKQLINEEKNNSIINHHQ